MAWRRPGDKPLYEPMLPWFIDAYMSLGLNVLTHNHDVKIQIVEYILLYTRNWFIGWFIGFDVSFDAERPYTITMC